VGALAAAALAVVATTLLGASSATALPRWLRLTAVAAQAAMEPVAATFDDGHHYLLRCAGSMGVDALLLDAPHVLFKWAVLWTARLWTRVQSPYVVPEALPTLGVLHLVFAGGAAAIAIYLYKWLATKTTRRGGAATKKE